MAVKTLDDLMKNIGPKTPASLARVMSLQPTQTLSETEQYAQSNEERRALLAMAGRKDPTEKKPSFFDKAMGTLSAPGAAATAGIYNLTNRPGTEDVSILGETLKSIRGEGRVTGADILKEQGISDKWGLMLGGIALDVLTDPTTYLTAGVSSLTKAKAATKVVGLLDDIADVGKYADDAARAMALTEKYGDEVARLVGTARDFKAIDPKAQARIASLIRLQTAEEIGGKAGRAGIRFMGAEIPGTRQLPELLTSTAKETAARLPGAETFQKAFLAGNLDGVWKYMTQDETAEGLSGLLKQNGPGELGRMASRAAVRGKIGGERAANTAGRLAKETIEQMVPDERVRAAMTIGIGRQFGDVASQRPVLEARQALRDAQELVKAGNKYAEQAVERALGDYTDAVKRLVFDPDAIAESVRVGVPDATDEMVQAARDATTYIQTNLDLLGEARTKAYARAGKVDEVGGLADELAKIDEDMTLPSSTAYVYGMQGNISPEVRAVVSRLNPEIDFSKLKAIDESKSFLPSSTKAKKLVNAEDRLLNGEPTELDVANWFGAKTTADQRAITYANFRSDIGKVTGLDPQNPIINDAVDKLSQPFINDGALRDVMRVYDTVLNGWKALATVFNVPRFQVRNGLSGQYLQFANGAWDLASQEESIKFLTRVGKAAKGKNPLTSLSPDDLARYTEMVDNGVLVTGEQLADIRDLTKVRASKVAEETGQTLDEVLTGTVERVGKAAKSPFASIKNFGMDMNSVVENQGRIAVYLNAIKKGASPEEAARIVDEVMYAYDPQLLTSFENNVIKRMLPFYTWMRRNTPQLMKLLVKNPKTWGIPMAAVRESQSAFGVDTSLFPEYLQDGGLLFFGEDDKTGDKRAIKVFDTLFPVSTAQQAMNFAADPITGARELAQQLNPLLRVPLEVGTNYSLYKDEVLEGGYQGTNRRASSGTQLLDDLLRETPAWKAWVESQGGYWDVDQQGRKVLMIPGKTAHVLGNILPTLESIGRMSPEAAGSRDQLIGWFVGMKPQRVNEAELGQSKIQSDYFDLQNAIADYKRELKGQTLSEAMSGGASPQEIERIRESMDGITLDELLGGIGGR